MAGLQEAHQKVRCRGRTGGHHGIIADGRSANRKLRQTHNKSSRQKREVDLPRGRKTRQYRQQNRAGGEQRCQKAHETNGPIFGNLRRTVQVLAWTARRQRRSGIREREGRHDNVVERRLVALVVCRVVRRQAEVVVDVPGVEPMLWFIRRLKNWKRKTRATQSRYPGT